MLRRVKQDATTFTTQLTVVQSGNNAISRRPFCKQQASQSEAERLDILVSDVTHREISLRGL